MSDAVVYKFGKDAILTYGTAGTAGATAAQDVKDLTLTATNTEIDITTRDSDGFKEYAAGLTDLELSWGQLVRATGAFYLALRAAFTGKTGIALKALNGTGGEGIDADWIITDMTEEQNLDDTVNISVKAKPTSIAGRHPTWVAASA
jgi:predicted secreted protein